VNWDLLQQSVLLSGVVTLLALALGALASVGLATLSSGWRRGAQVGLVVALALPPFLIANSWLRLLGSEGFLRSAFNFSPFSFQVCVMVMTFLFTPITALLLASAWNSIDGRLLESERRLAGWAFLRHAFWPAASGHLAVAGLLTFVLGFNHFSIPALFQVKVYPVELWLNFNTNFDYKAAMVNAIPLVIIPAAGLCALRGRRIRFTAAGATSSPALLRARVGTPMVVCGLLALAGVIAGGTLPLWHLIFSLETWETLGTTVSTNRRELANSALLATMTATVTLFVGLLTWRASGLKALWLLFFVPGALLGIGLIWLFNRPGLGWFYQSLGIALLALSLRHIGFAWAGVRNAQLGRDERLIESARLSGASRWQIFRHAAWPQLAPKLLGAWMVVYLLTLWDVEAMSLIVPPGGETVSWRVFNLLHYGHTAQVNAMCLLVVAVSLAPLALWWAARKLGVAGAAAGIALLVSGCSPAPLGHTEVESQIFGSVKIIGSRGAGAGQFNKPRSVACDRDDNLYVADITGRIQKFSPEGQYLLSWQMPQTDIGKPKGMERDVDGNIIVIEPHYARVNHFNPDGKLVHQWGIHGTNAGQLSFPRAAAMTRDGSLWISEYGATERVQLFDKTGAKCAMAFGVRGSKPGEFDRPEGIGIGREGELLVADSCNHRVQIFTPDGRFASEFGKPGTGTGELGYPGDVRSDFEGRIYVAEFGNSRIQVFDRSGKSLEIIGSLGPAPGQFHNPWSIAFDSRGNLYVADAANHRVQKFIRREQHTAQTRQIGGKAG